MPFVKHAKVPVIYLASGTYDDKLGKVAFKRTARSLYKSDGSQIDVTTALKIAASEYAISDDPKDYIFEAARAVTADVPNENGDAFPKSELMRFDHRLGKHVYQTFILKPHHINHRADNPKTARGLVLDAFYNDSSPALDACPACNNKTASADGRDSTGLCCKKCGEVVKDEFVELLIAIDTKKDPTFADGVKTGALDSLSMGCEAGYTDCSVCDNRARTVSQFCAHIKSGNKKKMFKAASGKDMMSFEKCGEVVFTEISRVDQPADPTALQREVFSLEATSIQNESEVLVLSARLAKIEQAMVKMAQAEPEFSPQMPFKTVAESIRWAQNSVSKLKGDIARLTAERDQKHRSASEDGRPLYAWESAAYDTQIKANKQYISRLEGYVLKARELEASGKPFGKDLTRSMSRFFASKEAQTDMNEIKDTLDELGQMHPDMAKQIGDELSQQSTDPNAVQPVEQQQQTIGEYAKEQEALQQDHMVTTDELGMKLDTGATPAPPGVKASKSATELAADLDLVFDTFTESEIMPSTNFATSYKNIQAKVTDSGNVRVLTGHGPLFVVRGSKDVSGVKLAKTILASIAQVGLVDTVAKFHGVVSPKMAQILQHHLEDFAGGREDGNKKAITELGVRDGVEPSKAPKSLVDEMNHDRAEDIREKRNLGNADVLEEHQPDHAEALPKGLTPMTDEEHSERRDERAKKPKSTLDEIALDRADKKAEKSAQMKPEDGEGGDKDGGEKEAKGKKEMPPEFLKNIKKKKAGDDESDESEEHDEADESEGHEESEKSEELEEMMEKLHDLEEADLKQLLNAVESILEPEGGAAIIEIGAPMELGEKEAVGDMCAALECKGSAPHSADTCPNKKAQDMAPGIPTTNAPVASVASKTASRLERLYKNRLEQTSAKMAEKTAAVAKETEAKFARALRLAAARQVLNIEESPIKAAMFDVLSNEHSIDDDSFYPGMDSVTASVIVENTMQAGYNDFVDTLMKRASEFLVLSDDAFAAIEADVKNLRPVPVQVQAAVQRVASRDDMRRAAVGGNMVLAPSSAGEGIPDVSKRDSIRSALDTTKVRRASAGLLNKKS